MSDPIHHLRSQLALQITRDDLLHRFPGIISYLTRFYQDTMTVFVVSYFYIQKAKTTNQNQTLSEFLSGFTFERHLSPILYDHLHSHYAEISKLIQQVITAIPDPLDIKIVGDFHGASTTRILITCSDGKQIIACGNPYTSDNTIIDRYAHYRQDGDFAPRYKTIGTLHTRDYLIIDNQFTKKELPDLYHAWGAKTAFVLALRAIDLHYENFLIADKKPYFFDFECIVTPLLDGYDYNISIAGLIDDPSLSKKNSTLFGGRDEQLDKMTPHITSYGTDPKINWKTKVPPTTIHIPYVKGEEANIRDYQTDFLAGYDAMTKILLTNPLNISEYLASHQPYTRILLRPTKIYRTIIKDLVMQATLNPDLDTTQFLREKLQKLPILTQINDPEPLIDVEITLLRKGIIPTFYADIHHRDLYSTVMKISDSLPVSPYDILIQHWSHLEHFLLEQRATLQNTLKNG